MKPDKIPDFMFFEVLDDVVIGSGIKMIGDDEKILDHAEMFDLREKLEEHLEKRQEVTHVVNQVTDDGSKWLYVFCVHTLPGDSGFVLMICDKSDSNACGFANDMLEFRLKESGIAEYHNAEPPPKAANA